ncbi:hypothetical protein [Absidia glauca]|uniref:F-box domain-containing protein n=1 Tax=Absidia glauca TaxID=4829 RepID=A0A163KRF6_ABSGL|nr:hypothetical protein [Absidia glauca]
MSYFDHAPIEVLFLVLNSIDQQSDLHQCALVNKSFYAAANPLLWREPKKAGGYERREHSIAFRLAQSFRQTRKHGLRAISLGHHIRKLKLLEDNRLRDMHPVINNAPLVEELDLGINKLKEFDMERIAKKCPQLKRLVLESLFKASDHVMDPLRHCPNLRDLSIRTCFHSKHQLESLKHLRLEKFTFWTFSYEGPPMDVFFGGIPTLTHLNLDGITAAYFRHYGTLRSPTLFPVLTDLDISMSYDSGVADDSVVSFFKAHPLIRSLTIRCLKIDPAIMTSLATDLVHLKHLSFCGNGHLPPLTKALPLVERLTIWRCHMGIEAMIDMATQLPNIPYLHISKHNDHRREYYRYIPGDVIPSDGPIIESLIPQTYLDFASYDSVPADLNVHLPRRTDGTLTTEDLEHIRETAVGLFWIDE